MHLVKRKYIVPTHAYWLRIVFPLYRFRWYSDEIKLVYDPNVMKEHRLQTKS